MVNPDGTPDPLRGDHRGPRLPIELMEEVVADAWKDTATPLQRRRLYETLNKAHPSLGEIVDRVVIRFPVLSPIAGPEDSDMVLYAELMSRAWDRFACGTEERVAANANAAADEESLFRHSHIILESPVLDLAHDYAFMHTAFHSASELILRNSSSVTVRHVQPPRTVRRAARGYMSDSPPSDGVFRLLSTMGRLTHLHLDYDGDPGYGSEGSMWVGTPIPTVVFLRMRCYPCCGTPSPARAIGIHAPKCPRTGLAQPFPNLRELRLDAPLFVKLLDAPPSLTKLTIDAPPDVKPFCSIQGYNVGAGLRQGFMTAGAYPRANVVDGWTPKKTIVVRSGSQKPFGWQPAAEACAKYGILLVQDVVYGGGET
ncbi:hypothetical protein BV20DRAFT_967168 [Pilatotrama ljubarskyi]|nr:hypothetical protein BV20DRAFT_967168 [Pilatotrama ljubarskyi]